MADCPNGRLKANSDSRACVPAGVATRFLFDSGSSIIVLCSLYWRWLFCLILLGLVTFCRCCSLILNLRTSDRLGLFSNDALFTLGDVSRRTNQRANPRGLALQLGHKIVADLQVADLLAARGLIVLDRGLSCVVQIAVNHAGKTAQPGQLLLRRAHLVGRVDIGRARFVKGRSH